MKVMIMNVFVMGKAFWMIWIPGANMIYLYPVMIRKVRVYIKKERGAVTLTACNLTHVATDKIHQL